MALGGSLLPPFRRPVLPTPAATSAYSVGVKRYGGTGRDNPTMGPVDPMGYAERDAQAQARRNAMLRRLKAGQQNRFMSSDWLGGQR